MIQTNAEAPLRGSRYAGKAVRILGRDHRRRLGRTRRAVHQRIRRSGAKVRLVAIAHAGRAHQPLGPHFPAQRPLRFQAALARRTRLRLADELRRPRAVLRQGRNADRRLRRQRGPREHAQLAGGRVAAAAKAARQRSADRSSVARNSAFPSIAGHRAVLTKRARPHAPAQTAAPRQREGAADPRRRHAEARRLLLRHALRPRLLDPG